jgi:hypothetical protein
MNPTQSRNGFVYLLIIVAILAIVVYSWRGQTPARYDGHDGSGYRDPQRQRQANHGHWDDLTG